MGYLLDWYTANSEKIHHPVNMQVIKFIDEISGFPSRDGNIRDQIDHLFCAGYCYYFANMLKVAFGGQICWVQDRGHIVWVDVPEGSDLDELQNTCAYDITGVYEDYDMLWPISYLGKTVVDYMHNGQTFHLNQDFANWCKLCHVTEIYAVTMIWGLIPMDEIMAQYKNGLDCAETAYLYWKEYTDEIQQLFLYIHNHNPLIWPHHEGPQSCLNRIRKNH